MTYRTPPHPAEVATMRGIAAPTTTTGLNGASAQAAARLQTTKATVARWIETAAAYYAAAALYRQLSRLSDAGLERRGLSRVRLAQDVADARQRRAGGSR